MKDPNATRLWPLLTALFPQWWPDIKERGVFKTSARERNRKKKLRARMRERGLTSHGVPYQGRYAKDEKWVAAALRQQEQSHEDVSKAA